MAKPQKYEPTRFVRDDDGQKVPHPEKPGRFLTEKTGKTVWRARYRDEAGKEHAKQFRRKTDAQGWIDKVTTSVVTGMYVDPKAGKITFRVFFEEWVARQLWKDGTVEAATMAVASTPFVDVPLAKINHAHVETWVKTMSQSLAPTTVKMRFQYVRMVFRGAIRDKRITVDPTDDVKLPKVEKAATAMSIPTPAAVAAVMGEAPLHFRPFIAVCAFAGLRLGEAAALQVGDINFLKRTLDVKRQVQGGLNTQLTITEPKAFSIRTIYVPEELIEMLARHVEEVGVRRSVISVSSVSTTGDERWLFSSGPYLFQLHSAGYQWRQAAKGAGVTGHTLHSLRHFYASGLIAAGCDVVTVQRSLGHSQPSITLDT